MHLALDSDAFLYEKVVAPPGAKLSDTLGRHGDWLDFSATSILETDGRKVTLKKRATVPFVVATMPNAAKEERKIALGSVGAQVHLVTTRAATLQAPEVAKWWKGTGPFP